MTARLSLLAAGVAAWIALVATGGDDRPRILKVGLDNAAGLVVHDEVRMSGVVVGDIRALHVTPDTHVVADIALRNGIGPFATTARAEIRAANLFGGKYLALVPGPRTPTTGWTIPRPRTSTPVEVDDVLDTLDRDTRVRLATLLGEAGLGLAGRGTDLRTLLAALPPTLDETTRLVGDLSADNRTLGRLVADTSRVAAGLAPERAGIAHFVARARAAAAGFARERTALRRTVHEAPGTIARLRDALQRLQHVARPLGPAADALRQTAAPLDDTLTALPALERDAAPALRAAGRAATPLRTLGTTASPVLHRAAPTLAAAADVSRELEPVTRILRDEAAPLIGVLQGWARATQRFDGLGHYFRGEYVINADDLVKAVADPVARRSSRAPKDRERPARPAPSRSDDRPPATRPPLRLPAIEIPGLPPIDLGGLLGGRTSDDAPVTKQLLDFLLKP